VQPTVQQVRLFSIPKYLKFFKYYKSDTILHCKLYNSIWDNSKRKKFGLKFFCYVFFIVWYVPLCICTYLLCMYANVPDNIVFVHMYVLFVQSTEVWGHF
jgi:hypothetical protein